VPGLEEIHTALQRAERALPPPESLPEGDSRSAAARLAERLRRDLLPRLAGHGPVLLVAIAGPNNVGKSSLFNALVGRAISPARAEGGLTKQCLAAAHPWLWSGDLRAFVERRFDVVAIPDGASAPVDQPGPPGRLYLVLAEEVPRGLLLLDTPDFDSVYLQNRINSEALLVTVDLVIFMVSRQTYQNAALVGFLRSVVGHGRPYLLVYNEAVRVETARGHLDKLAADVGHAPVGRFYAVHQPEVEAGRALLSTEPLDRAPPLKALLGDPAHSGPLKAKALSAGMRDAAAELRIVAKALSARVAEPERLRARLRHELRSVGTRAAAKAVPADVLIQAFREELDARSRYHKWIRMPFRALTAALGFVGRKVKAAVAGPAPAEEQVAALTEQALKDGLRRMVESLGPELAAWRGDARIGELLVDAIGPRTLSALERPLDLPELRHPDEDRRQLHAFCRELIARELQEGGDLEVALQTLTTLLYSAPAGAAAAISVATSGLGHDAAVWAASALSAPLFEKLVDLLGSSVRSRVTRRWAEAHGETLARALERQFFGGLLDALDAAVSSGERTALELEEARAVIAQAAERPTG
jgi:50S ribosome-binding GTPase